MSEVPMKDKVITPKDVVTIVLAQQYFPRPEEVSRFKDLLDDDVITVRITKGAVVGIVNLARELTA